MAYDSVDSIYVAGDVTINDGGMKIFYDGVIDEETIITDFFSWYAENDSTIVDVLTEALEDGYITVWVGSIKCKIVEYNFDDNTLTLTFIIPEPASVSAVLGVLVLSFAFLRRRK